MLVGITGRAQHGKDTIGQFLVDQGAYRIAFADPLKELALLLDPIVNSFVEYDPMAESGYVAVPQRLSEEVEAGGWELAKQNPEVRRFLQELGTRIREVVGPNVWVDIAERKWVESGAANTVITDVRFPNEADFILRHSGLLLGVVRPDFDNGVSEDHESEAHVPELLKRCQFVVTNDASLAALRDRAEHAVRSFLVMA